MIWILAILSPLLVLLLSGIPGLRQVAGKLLLPLAPLPGLWVALFEPIDGGADFASVLLGLRLGFGTAGQIFLLFTSLLWLAAGIYSRGYLKNDPRRTRFDGFFLLTMTGNFGLILSQDVPGFYTFFALMTFSAFGLVIHTGTEAAKRAARIYLITALVGEALLLGAIFLAVGAADSVRLEDLASAVGESKSRNLILFLAFFGFGVKAGALPMHFWLPLAHPVAPVPASAVLSGAMIKAGLLGWLHFIPLGHGTYPGWGLFCILAGMAAALGAVLVGLTMEDPKTTLAYSSISQMGVMTVLLGIGLSAPIAWVATLPVLLLYALNHALAKGALFLGAGIVHSVAGRARVLVTAVLAIPALSIAGAPWTGGSMTKYAIKDLLVQLPDWMVPWLSGFLPLTSLATAVLLGRFLSLVGKGAVGKNRVQLSMWISWLALVGSVAAAVTFATGFYSIEIASTPASLSTLWSEAQPILIALLVLFFLGHIYRKRRRIPAGDMLVVFEWLVFWLRRRWEARSFPNRLQGKIRWFASLEHLPESERRSDFTTRMEERMRHRSVPGVLFMLLILTLAALLIFGTS
jgi:formate hydrogenlyase subunit 3/multisubunit Na+/H+ antiporter MnhD subunit